jgi:hypothetical protein
MRNAVGGDMSADLLKPWIELITWPLLALLGGVAVIPAIYIFLFKIASAKIGGAEFQLSRKQVDHLEEAAEEIAEASTPQAAAEQLTLPPGDESADPEERLFAALTTWQNLQILTKARASRLGGREDLRAVIPNLKTLAATYPDVLNDNDVRRAEELKEALSQYKSRPADLTKSALRSFRIRAGKIARKVEGIPLDPPPLRSVSAT